MSVDTWRRPSEWDNRIMTALIGWGYSPSDVETLLTSNADDNNDPRTTSTTATRTGTTRLTVRPKAVASGSRSPQLTHTSPDVTSRWSASRGAKAHGRAWLHVSGGDGPSPDFAPKEFIEHPAAPIAPRAAIEASCDLTSWSNVRSGIVKA